MKYNADEFRELANEHSDCYSDCNAGDALSASLLCAVDEAERLRAGSESGASMIARERRRQIEEEHFTTDRDIEEHPRGQLIEAALCYLSEAQLQRKSPNRLWPWARRWWKPGDPIRMLVKAGALIAAEIDRRLAVERNEAKPA